MNSIFHDLIGKIMKVYIDDVVAKSTAVETHLSNLKQSFDRKHGLKINPLKCAFGISASNFLAFLVHKKGIELDKHKANTTRNLLITNGYY